MLEMMGNHLAENDVREFLRLVVAKRGVQHQSTPLAVDGIGVDEVVVDRGLGWHNAPAPRPSSRTLKRGKPGWRPGRHGRLVTDGTPRGRPPQQLGSRPGKPRSRAGPS